LDFVRYAEHHGIKYNPNSNYAITLDVLKEIIKEENLTIRQGDILIVRTGLSKWFYESDEATLKSFNAHSLIGVDPSDEMLEFIWDSGFAAVGTDALAFEAAPDKNGNSLKLHSHVLSLFGCMIAELLDLEAVAKLAEKHQRWSFFLASAPLNIPGGIASVANIVATF